MHGLAPSTLHVKKDGSGFTVTFLSMVAAPLLGFVLGMVEYNNAIKLKDRLQAAADAAVLAVVSQADDANRLSDPTEEASMTRALGIIGRHVSEQTRGMPEFSMASPDIAVTLRNQATFARVCLSGRQVTATLGLVGIDHIPIKVCSEGSSSPPSPSKA
jgi:hypothetical protein